MAHVLSSTAVLTVSFRCQKQNPIKGECLKLQPTEYRCIFISVTYLAHNKAPAELQSLHFSLSQGLVFH